MNTQVDDFGDIEMLFGFWGLGAFVIGGLGVLFGLCLYELSIVTAVIFALGTIGCFLGRKRLPDGDVLFSGNVNLFLFALTCGAALCLPVVLAINFAVVSNSAPSGLFISGVTLLASLGLYLVIKYIKEA